MSNAPGSSGRHLGPFPSGVMVSISRDFAAVYGDDKDEWWSWPVSYWGGGGG